MFDNKQLFSGDKFNVRKQTHLLILQLFDHVHYRKHAIRTWELITDTSKVYSICFLFLNLADILSWCQRLANTVLQSLLRFLFRAPDHLYDLSFLFIGDGENYVLVRGNTGQFRYFVWLGVFSHTYCFPYFWLLTTSWTKTTWPKSIMQACLTVIRRVRRNTRLDGLKLFHFILNAEKKAPLQK